MTARIRDPAIEALLQAVRRPSTPDAYEPRLRQAPGAPAGVPAILVGEVISGLAAGHATEYWWDSGSPPREAGYWWDQVDPPTGGIPSRNSATRDAEGKHNGASVRGLHAPGKFWPLPIGTRIAVSGIPGSWVLTGVGYHPAFFDDGWIDICIEDMTIRHAVPGPLEFAFNGCLVQCWEFDARGHFRAAKVNNVWIGPSV